MGLANWFIYNIQANGLFLQSRVVNMFSWHWPYYEKMQIGIVTQKSQTCLLAGGLREKES